MCLCNNQRAWSGGFILLRARLGPILFGAGLDLFETVLFIWGLFGPFGTHLKPKVLAAWGDSQVTSQSMLLDCQHLTAFKQESSTLVRHTVWLLAAIETPVRARWPCGAARNSS